MTYSKEEEECADKLYASIPHISDEYVLDPDSQKCIVGGQGRDACTVSERGAVISCAKLLWVSMVCILYRYFSLFPLGSQRSYGEER